jgi:trehalose 6-phosphate synthase
MDQGNGMAGKTKGVETPLIVIVSNRGPLNFSQNEDGTFEVVRGSGGLVTALGPLAEENEVLWVACALSEDDIAWSRAQTEVFTRVEGIYLRLMEPDPEAYEAYYNIIANPLLWFIQHQLWDIPRHPSITQEVWDAWEHGYQAINRQFAEEIAAVVSGSDHPVIVLPQDYHTYLVAYYLREMLGEWIYIQPFIHIPWPGPDAWRILPGPMRETLLRGLLASDRVGFQTKRDAFNFVQTCRFYLSDAHSRGSRDSITYRERVIPTVAYPISVDIERLPALAEENQTRLFKSQLINLIGDKKLILRVDRIEPSKNILRGLEAFEALLNEHPEHHGKIIMLALLVPSRMGVDEYQSYTRDLMAAAGMINATFSDPFWEPVRIVIGDNYPRAIAAMQLYDVLLVNPIADGMNLVAKEGVLVNQRDGVLILSEHAGAFYELGEYAISVSPFDVHGTAEAIHNALTLPLDEKAERATALREIVQSADLKHWFQSQLVDAEKTLLNQPRKVSTPGTP